MSNYVNVNRPMTYGELMGVAVPPTLRGDSYAEKAQRAEIARLMKRMTAFLLESRRVSRMSADTFTKARKGTPTAIRIRGIQEQMSACRFRLSIHDYENAAERETLKLQLYELYANAKIIDPDGVAKFERKVDKSMGKRRK